MEENGVGKRDKRKHDGDERVKKKGKSEKQVGHETHMISEALNTYAYMNLQRRNTNALW